MGFNLQLGDALRSESVTAIDDAIRAIARQEIDRTPRTKFCDACAYMHQPEISARCCCVACHGDDVPAWAQRMNTPPSIEKTGESASSGSASGRTTVLNADAPASPASVPEWVPSVDEIQQFIDDGREGDLRALIFSRYVEWRAAHLVEEPGFDKGWDAAKRRFDERAPRPAPQPSVEYDLYMATNRAAILSETIDSLHKMIETLAAEAGESHGVDEPVQNCAAVSRALAARDESQPSVEELARKIAARIYGDDGQYVEPQHHAWQAAEVALAALSAMPASEATQPEREAQGEPPTIEECRSVFDEACENALKNPRLSRRAADYEGVAAGRTLCLSRAPAPAPALAALVEAVSVVMEHDCPVCFDYTPASQAAMRRWINLGNEYRSARAALPKGGAA